MKYPETAGFKEDTTSRDAALSMASLSSPLRKTVLNYIKKFPSTPDECAEGICESVLSVRPRITELKNLGFIKASGLTRKNYSGRNAKVWTAC